jgi:hypothetical protein
MWECPSAKQTRPCPRPRVVISILMYFLCSQHLSLGGFHKEIYALHMKLALSAQFLHKFTIIWNHAFAPCTQLSAFFPRFGCALRFALWAQLLYKKSTPSLACHTASPYHLISNHNRQQCASLMRMIELLIASMEVDIYWRKIPRQSGFLNLDIFCIL